MNYWVCLKCGTETESRHFHCWIDCIEILKAQLLNSAEETL